MSMPVQHFIMRRFQRFVWKFYFDESHCLFAINKLFNISLFIFNSLDIKFITFFHAVFHI